MTSLRPLSLLVLVVLVLQLAACKAPFGTHDEEPWVSHEVAAPSENVLWHVSSMALGKAGFHVGSGADPTTLVMTTGWRTSLAPFRGDGHRERAHLKLTATTAGHWRIDLRVEKQTNEDIKHPMDPANAEWKTQPDDADAADMILRRIRATLGEDLPAVPAQKPGTQP